MNTITRHLALTLTGLSILCVVGWYVDRIAHNQIVGLVDEALTIGRFILYTLAYTLILTLMGVSILFLWSVWERVLIRQANRKIVQREADVYSIVSDTHGVFVREMNPSAVWRPLHLNPTTYQNGRQLEANPLEVTTWQTWTLRNQPNVFKDVTPALLPDRIESELDLLTVFTQPTQSYAIIGGQQTGKTYQARHIAAYWLRNGIQPIIIGPKWDKAEWDGCIRLGGNGSFVEVRKGITIVRRIVEKRHADERGHKEHNILPVFFDDWTPIVDAVDNARALVLEATTLYASVNIILYFILHSDTANAWGVDRKGAALKDNFVKLFITPTYDEQGRVIRSRTKGIIRFAGESTDRPVKLIDDPIFQGGPVIDSDFIPLDLEPEPSPAEAHILALYEQGQSISAIAAAVYGSKGGNQNERVKTVLDQYGVKV